jgi:RNA polymerase sigma-70 factor (ECF subfamily)
VQAERLEVEFARWYREDFTYVRYTLRRLGVPRSSVADLVHEVFAVAWRKLSEYDPARARRAWLFGIAFRVAVGHRRRHSPRSFEPFESIAEPADVTPSPVEQLEQRERTALVHEALERVSFKPRAVLLLHDFDERPMYEIARALSIPVKTGYSRLRLGREQLRRALEQRARINVEPRP